jgi:dihydroorotate dehydrogenase
MRYAVLKPLLFRLDAERAHNLVSSLLGMAGRSPLALAAMRAMYAYDDPALAVTCGGLHFTNPLGLAAGFDKKATMIGPLHALGFGHVEVGTVTPRPQPGNPRPRMFRLPEDRALINRLGFNSPGMLSVARRLQSYRENQEPGTKNRSRCRSAAPGSLILGVNIGKNRTTALEHATEDYLAAFVALAPLADYVTVNISSPNTPGLRQLHARAALEDLLGTLMHANRQLPQPRPLFVKVSPDETAAQLDEVVDVAQACGVAGFVATNTTLDRQGLRSGNRAEAGGLSGQPLARRARAVISHLYMATNKQLPIIGVGGVAGAADAYQHMAAGATLVQLYTGMIYEGPAIAQTIKRGLVELLRQHGHRSIDEVVGCGVQ